MPSIGAAINSNGATLQPDEKTVTGRDLTQLTTSSANKRSRPGSGVAGVVPFQFNWRSLTIGNESHGPGCAWIGWNPPVVAM